MSAATSMTAVESPSAYPESPLDGDDVVYPCKGCGEILEEGKAFELAGNRWHIDCFRCNTCGTLLDSDANLLLLGDGSLICNNCTYSCSACGNKIEDLAILTGDQAFCSSCFRCRNCKRKIDNLRYARTSQGIFCMSCHESLMARRRKKPRAAPKAPSSNGPGVEKALPSLPPDATKGHSVGTPSDAASQSPRVPSVGTPPEIVADSRTTQDQQRSPRERQTRPRNESINAYTSFMRDASPTSEDVVRGGLLDSSQRQQTRSTTESNSDGPTLPASTYSDGKSRPSNFVSDDDDDDESEGFLPMAFDPTPIAAPPVSRKPAPRHPEPSPPVQPQSENRAPRDYFNSSGRLSARPADQQSTSSRSASTEREREIDRPTPKASPHILSQDKGRLGSGRKRDLPAPTASVNGAAVTSPIAANLQEKSQRQTPQPPVSEAQPSQQHEEQPKPQNASQHKRAGSRSIANSPAPISTVDRASAAESSVNAPSSPISVNSRNSGINPFDDPKRKESPLVASPPQMKNQLPLRADSLNAVAHRKQPSQDISSTRPPHKRHPSTSSVPSTFIDAKGTISRDNSRASPADPGVTRSSIDALPPRSSSRPDASSKLSPNDDFSAPRAPPAPPVHGHRQHESISTLHSEDRRSLEGQPSPDPRSAGLPKYTSDGNFSMEDELGRILRDEKREGGDAAAPSVLRRVSSAIKHNRNFSERESSRPGKSPVNGAVEISSPIPIASPSMTSPTPTSLSQDSIDQVRASLRRAQVHIAELETDKLSLQEQLNGSSEIKAVNTELREKRSTMIVLDSQREIIVRELEVMTAHLAKAKDSRTPLDLGSLKTSILKDFAESLATLKGTMKSQIEDLIRKRNELTDEITTLIQMKDKGFQEYESLSNRNTQLLQHNNDLLRNIQGVYQENRGTNGAGTSNANGLGIYNGSSKGEGATPSDMRDFRAGSTDPSVLSSMPESEAEPITVHGAPQVINIRKGQKPTKFNWRKGGESLAKNVTKGLKGAFAADRLPPSREGAIGVPYNATHQVISGSELSSNASTKLGTEDSRSGSSAGFGFFNQKNGGGLRIAKDGNGSVASTDGSVLFGSELQTRCDYENRVIPSIVSRCIQEVEARGMDVEGIYRKSGGAGQVKSVQQGFEKDHDHPISDPDLEIHAVTSALKQYFRKLPTPLIVYSVYDSLLEAGQMTADRDKQVVALKLAVHDLPDAHRDCLQFLVQHLARVMAHDARNLMTALNLAVVFAPTIMRPLSIEREMTDMQTQRAAVQALLENHRSVFPE